MSGSRLPITNEHIQLTIKNLETKEKELEQLGANTMATTFANPQEQTRLKLSIERGKALLSNAKVGLVLKEREIAGGRGNPDSEETRILLRSALVALREYGELKDTVNSKLPTLTPPASTTRSASGPKSGSKDDSEIGKKEKKDPRERVTPRPTRRKSASAAGSARLSTPNMATNAADPSTTPESDADAIDAFLASLSEPDPALRSTRILPPPPPPLGSGTGVGLPPAPPAITSTTPLPSAPTSLPPPPTLTSPINYIAGDQGDVDAIHANIATYKKALDMHLAQTKLAIRSASVRKSVLKRQKEIQDELQLMLSSLNFYSDHANNPTSGTKENVTALMTQATQALTNLHNVQSSANQAKMMTGLALVAEYVALSPEDARNKLISQQLPTSAVAGLSSPPGGEIDADFKKPYVTVEAIKVDAATTIRFGMMQFHDTQTNQLRTEYHLQAGDLQKMNNVKTTDKEFINILDLVQTQIAKHRAHPNGADSPLLINGEGLSRAVIEAHFALCKEWHIPIHPYSEVLCNFRESDVSKQCSQLVHDLAKRPLRPGAGSTPLDAKEAKQISDDLQKAVQNQPHRPKP